MTQGKKKKSRRWSLKEIEEIVSIVDTAVAAGKTKVDGYKEAATHFGVTKNAIHIRYGRYQKGTSMQSALGKKKTTKRTSKRWSMKDIRFIQRCIKEKQTKGKDKKTSRVEGVGVAAKALGVSYNATWNRLYVYEQGKYLSGLKKNTTKIPIKKKYTGKHKKPVTIDPALYTVSEREITFDIKDVRVDLENKKITIIY